MAVDTDEFDQILNRLRGEKSIPSAVTVQVDESDALAVFEKTFSLKHSSRPTLSQRAAQERAAVWPGGKGTPELGVRSRKGGRTKTFTFRAAEPWLLQLRSYSKSRNMTATDLIKEAVNFYIYHYPVEMKDRRK